jgi:hypothetical protein
MTREEFYNSIGYHKMTPQSTDVAFTMQNLRQGAKDFGDVIFMNTEPHSREQMIALQHVEDALAWATKQVAITKLPVAEPLK